jgi:glycerol-3-phosphate acyltransferase PlsY
MSAFFCILAGFFSGSVPYSVWIGRWLLCADIRTYGDGNPGSTNVFRAGGKLSGLLAVLLDGFKAAIPVGLAAYWAYLPAPALFAAALAPVLGHMFSPFLRGKGGKGVAAVFGMWAGLTFGEVPILLGLFMGLWVFVTDSSAWAVMFSLLGVLAHLLLNHPDPFLLLIWVTSSALLVWTHRAELKQAPRLRLIKQQQPPL